jgi:hypothetical protein
VKRRLRTSIGAALWILAAAALHGQTSPADSGRVRLSNDGVVRATAQVDSVFVDRQKRAAEIGGGDWASYLLARLGAGKIPDGVGIEVRVDTARIVVQGRFQDLPQETRALLGPIASMVDSSTVIAAEVLMERTGPEVVRFWLRGLRVNGFPFPEFLLASMMASIGKQYPALTASGRDLYVQVPPDGRITLGDGTILLSLASPTGPAQTTPAPPPPRSNPRPGVRPR